MTPTEVAEWSAVPPSAKEHCYRYSVSVRGTSVPAYLTYRLTGEGAPSRDLLLIKRNYFLPRHQLVSDIDRSTLAALEREIEALRPTHSAITTAKSIVNSIYEETTPLQNLAVAVHRLGPVPVYVLHNPLPIQVFDGIEPRSVTARVAVYQDLARSPFGPVWPASNVNRQQFLASLEADLPVILREYFEDVAEIFFDIQHHLSLSESLEACRQIEEVIARSIESKVKIVINHRKYDADARATAKRLVEQYPETLLLGRYFRSYALLLLNQLYRMLGLKDRCSRYSEQLLAIEGDFNRIYGDQSAFEQTIGESPELSTLELCRESARKGVEAVENLEVPKVCPGWVRRIVGFQRFVALLAEEGFQSEQVKLFFSAQHGVGVPEAVRMAFEREVEKLGEQRVALSSVRAKAPAVDFKRLIANRIWQSETVAVVLPRSSLEIGGESEKTIAWLVREVDYAGSLGKRIVPLLEKGVDLEDVVKVAEGMTIDPLRPDRRRRVGREDVVMGIRDLGDKTFYVFSSDDIDEQFAALVVQEVTEACSRRVHSLIDGLVRFIGRTSDERRGLQLIHKATQLSPLMVEQLAPRAFPGRSGREARKAFESLRARVHQRRVVVHGAEVEVFEIVSGTRKYQSNLGRIAKLLLPTVPAGVVESAVAAGLGDA